MIAITISVAAFEAIQAQPLGQSMVAPPPGADGMIRVWLDGKFVDRLGRLRDPGESYSDVILRLAKEGSQGVWPAAVWPRIGQGPPEDEARAIPNLEAFERALAFCGHRVRFRYRVFVRKAGRKNLDAGNMSITQEITSHELLSAIGVAAATIGNYSRDGRVMRAFTAS